MKFRFDSYSLNNQTGEAEFRYRFGDEYSFSEKIQFELGDQPAVPAERAKLIDRALFLSFVLIGTSYYKAFPTTEVKLDQALDKWQASFFDSVYQEGLGQFAYENDLTRADLAHFADTVIDNAQPEKYNGTGILSPQSGGKDSLLTAVLLNKAGLDFTPWFLASGDHHPKVLDMLPGQLHLAVRSFDRESLNHAEADGGKNGHVPITYIMQSLALIQALILGKNQILLSIGHEGVEPNAHIGDLSVNHQWSKTWPAEQQMAEYVRRYISPDIQIGSPLRDLSELKIAELFYKYAWAEFGHDFSSCNVANYRQHADNSKLKWCGNCPKCANSFIIFAPFVPKSELKSLFDGQDLFAKQSLEHSFKGLLAIDGVEKPFECVGATDELRWGYHQAVKKGYTQLPFSVPEAPAYDYNQKYDGQTWAIELLRK
jgi:hypothetical protein